MAGLDIDKLGYKLHYCKGDYFRLSGKPPVKMLVYPVPKGPGLGIHLTPDLTGSIRLGPNAYYVDKISYEVESDEAEFRDDLRRFLPSIDKYRILTDSAGVRPKLQGPQDGFKDFVIKHEKHNGLFGFINLVGIESPGLTAAPAIGELVSEMYENEIAK
jgi:L-2-hydroxyglutarate oxidase LhgO